MINLLKTARYTLILTLLVPHIAIIGMENNKFMATRIKFNEIIARPFNHEKCQAYIKLSPQATIGYGDTDCIKSLNDINISADANSPLIPIQLIRPKNIIQIALKQTTSENKETMKLFRENAPTNPMIEIPIITEDLKRLAIRIKKMKQSAHDYETALFSIKQIPLMPIEHLLADNHITLNNVPFTFTEHQKLAALQKNFEEQPDTLFFTIQKSTAAKLNFIYGNQTSNGFIHATQQELYEQVEPKKTELRTKKIIQRRPHQSDDFQDYSDQTLFPSPIIKHISNYHNHGENGYSKEQLRKTMLKNTLREQNPFEFINTRETGDKRRKINNDIHLKISHS